MTIAGKNYRLNEMPIGKVKKLLLKLNESFQIIQQKIQERNDTSNDFKDFIINFSDVLFPELTDIFNIIFSCGNEDFEKFSVEFVENNISLAAIKRIFQTVIKMNELEDAIPFFKDSFLELLPSMIRKEIQERKEEKN
jgi:hypothetical protein